jgi:predicted ABC-type ATPase
VFKAAQKAAEILEQCLSESKSLAFETVLSAPDKVDFIRRAKKTCYFFVGTDVPSVNAKRVARQVMEGGHDESTGKIISRYAKSFANCYLIAKIANRSYQYVKHKAELRMTELVQSTNILVIASHSRGVILQTFNRAIWLEHGKIRMEGDTNRVAAAYFGR